MLISILVWFCVVVSFWVVIVIVCDYEVGISVFLGFLLLWIRGVVIMFGWVVYVKVYWFLL